MKVFFSRPRQGIRAGVCLLFLSLVFWIASSSSSNLFAQTAGTHRKVLVRTEPEYPAVLRNGHFEGQVRLEATVLEDGNVSKVEIRGGSPIFARFASQAVAKWKYAPGPTKTVEDVVITFNSAFGR